MNKRPIKEHFPHEYPEQDKCVCSDPIKVALTNKQCICFLTGIAAIIVLITLGVLWYCN